VTTKLRFFGISAFEITNSRGTRVLIDPYLDANSASPIKTDDLDKVDLTLVTHAAYDHLGDAGKIAKKFKTPVICGADVRAHLIKQGVAPEKLITTIWGLTIELAGVKVRSVESRHWSNVIEADGTYYSGPPMGFIVYADPEVRIYHSGDSALFSDLKLIGQLYRPNIGLINVSLGPLQDSPYLTGEMTPYEAALAAQWLGLDYVIPTHFATVDSHVDAFLELMNNMSSDSKPHVKPVLLKPGEVFTYPET
jgi:L-ascorbate metabolism protein UlaG (beta-lactamase superfamily)